MTSHAYLIPFHTDWSTKKVSRIQQRSCTGINCRKANLLKKNMYMRLKRLRIVLQKTRDVNEKACYTIARFCR